MARTSKKDENKKKILNATLKLISENGFHGTPMSKLAAMAEVSVGTIYLYYKNKDEMIIELFKEVREQMGAYVIDGWDERLEVREKFNTLFDNFLDYYVENPNEFSFMEQFGLSPYVKNIFETLSEPAWKALSNFYSSGVKSGVLKKTSMDVITSICYGPIISMVKKHHLGFVKVTPKIKKDLREACWNAIIVAS